MKLKGVRRFFVALAILPLLAGIAFASGAAAFVCRGDAVARPACCCPGSEHAAPAAKGAAPTLSASCCCDLSQMNVPATPAVAESHAAAQVAQHPTLLPVATPALASWSASARGWSTVRFAHPPPPAIPILLGKQSFLI